MNRLLREVVLNMTDAEARALTNGIVEGPESESDLAALSRFVLRMRRAVQGETAGPTPLPSPQAAGRNVSWGGDCPKCGHNRNAVALPK